MTILITGATGLVGKALIPVLLKAGHTVHTLGRRKSNISGTKNFTWNPPKKEIDTAAFNNVHAIIHLAGSNIADSRWTEARKSEIQRSRTEPTNLLVTSIENLEEPPRIFITASAIGYYGQKTTETIFKESHFPGNDFLGKTCALWEEAADSLTPQGIRVVKLRIGVVLANEGGALAKLLTPFQLGLGSAIGSGKQIMAWVHIKDLASVMHFAAEHNGMEGAFNIAAPQQVTNKEFSSTLAQVLKKPFILPNVPAFALRLFLGEMADIILEGNQVSVDKINAIGFQFRHPNLKGAMKHLLSIPPK